MAFEARLVDGAWPIVALAHVCLVFLVGEQLVLVSEDFLVPGAKVAHSLVVGGPHMAMQVRPAKPREIARRVWTVVAEEKNCIAHNVLVRIANSDIIVRGGGVGLGEVLEALLGIVGEHDKGGESLSG